MQHFGVILGYFGFTLSSLWCKLAEVGAKFGLSWPNLAPSSNPKGSINILYSFCRRILLRRRSAAPLPRGSGLSLFEVSNLEYFGTERTVPTRACGHKGRGPIYGLPPLPPTSSARHSSLVARFRHSEIPRSRDSGRRMSLVARNLGIPLCLLIYLLYLLYLL